MRRAFLLAGLALAGACDAAAPTGTSEASLVAPVSASVVAPELGRCDTLAAPAETKLSFRTYAVGDQIYRWNGASWTFVAPDADLFANENLTGLVGTHYAGPTWTTTSGSSVVAAVLKRCPGEGSTIPWLLLGAVSSAGAGVLAGTTHIQRVNTTGGTAPTTAGSFVGEERRVAYTAEYYFYRAR